MWNNSYIGDNELQSQQSKSARRKPTLTCSSFTSGGRLETMILSAGCAAVGAVAMAALPPLMAAAARARVAGAAVGLPRTAAFAGVRRVLVRRPALGRVAIIWGFVENAWRVVSRKVGTDLVESLIHSDAASVVSI